MARPATERYGIPEYGPRSTSDPMDVYSVYNQAMIIIDGILGGLQDQIDALKRRMTGAENRLTALEGRMDAAETEIENLKKRVTTAEQNITNLQGAVDQINEHLSQIDQSISQIEQNVTNLAGKSDATLADIVAKFYGGGTIGEDGHVTWGDTGKAATGNMNVFGNDALSSYIRTVEGTGTNSVRVM